ncbi:eukaryotic translation initiation factor 3 subunit C-like [Manihot esculenta]|uniref:eukaryotic translation initiation factor 3 subunit C-like n=1 Tax=Manihot esculenta TaxID=3983 RepID=UPI000B5D81D2|nr:eukaryotic translation initiation factor 3 subunit C-like [Manihot esculenta]
MPRHESSSSSAVHSGNGGNGGQTTKTVVRAPVRERGVSLQYPLLTKTNYAAWAIKMQVYMQAQGVWNVVESEDPVDPCSDRIALAAIFQGITEDTLLQLGVKKSAKEVWDALKVMNLGAERVKEVRAQALRWELKSMRMENVSPKYLQIASTIEEFGNLSVKTIEEVTGSFKAHEERLRSYDSRIDEHVLLTKGEWKARAESSKTNEKHPQDTTRGRGHRSGHGRGRDRGRGGGRGRGRGPPGTGRGQDDEEQLHQKFNIKKVRCYNCNEYGHFQSDCKAERKKQNEAHLVE